MHRVSVPGFEYVHLPLQLDENGELIETNAKDKPWRTVEAIQQNQKVEASILAVLTDLTSSVSEESLYGDDFENALLDEVQRWAGEHCPKNPRFGLKRERL